MLAWLSILAYRNGASHASDSLGDKIGRALPGAFYAGGGPSLLWAFACFCKGCQMF